MCALGKYTSVETNTVPLAPPLWPRKLSRLAVIWYVSPGVKALCGAEVTPDTASKLAVNMFSTAVNCAEEITTPAPVMAVTVKELACHGRPYAPVDDDKSTRRSAHGPMELGMTSTTTGGGMESSGATMATLIPGVMAGMLLPQLLVEAVVKYTHWLRKVTPTASVTPSPGPRLTALAL